MENLVTSAQALPSPEFWAGKNVFLTGHTGFKGGWLTLYLLEQGARVHGYALPPSPEGSVFQSCRLWERLVSNSIADIRDFSAMLSAMQAAQPDIVLHLAAQPLVRQSYVEPLETFAVNAMGTVHLLDAVRRTPGVRVVVNVTTDKCYVNQEWDLAYRENDALGGHDPYSGSKACSELITQSYRQAYFDVQGVWMATVRAGNVIGGGDFASDRLVPDFFRAAEAGLPLRVRSPKAVRPWQHVFDPLTGYLLLVERLWAHGRDFAEAWNFGPVPSPALRVCDVLNRLCVLEPRASWIAERDSRFHETSVLRLDSTKAQVRLQWRPRWGIDAALIQTAAWRKAWREGADMVAASLADLRGFLRDAEKETTLQP